MSAAAAIPTAKPQIRTAADPTVIRIIPELAEQIGLNESVMLLQIGFWIGSANSGRFIDGRWWTWQSVRDMHQKAFPYWSISTVNRTASKLIADGYLIEGNYNEKKYDKTRWFALNVEKIQTLKGVTVVMGEKPLVQNEPRSKQNDTRSRQNEPRSKQNDTTIPETPSETPSEKSTERTDKLLLANSEPVAPDAAPAVCLSVFQNPENTDEITLDDPHGEPGDEQNQPPEARSIVCFESSRADSASNPEPAAQFSSTRLEASSTNQQPVAAQSLPVEGEPLKAPPGSVPPPIEPFEDEPDTEPVPETLWKHNDFTHDDRIIPGLKPGDKPLYKPDDNWIRIVKAYDAAIGGTMSTTLMSDIQDGIQLRGADEVVKLIERAKNAKSSPTGMIIKALENWHNEAVPGGGIEKPGRREVDDWFNSIAKG